MSAKNRVLATLVGFVVLFLLGWLFYGLLLMDFYAANSGSATDVYRQDDQMIWWALIVSTILQAYLLVYIFGSVGDVSSFGDGLKTGAILGLILGLTINLGMYATSNIMNLTAALVDPVVSTVMMAVSGGVIGYMLGRK